MQFDIQMKVTNSITIHLPFSVYSPPNVCGIYPPFEVIIIRHIIRKEQREMVKESIVYQLKCSFMGYLFLSTSISEYL